MDNNSVVKIGSALKWRNTFDLTKKYYQENVVTACGCVFRCKVLQAQGKSPIKMTDDQGHIVYTNTDVWDVLVDMAYYYNYAVDTRKLTQQMLDYAKKLDEAFQKQQKEIEALQKDNKDQWDHINDIEKINAEQQRELNSIHDTISCFSEGIWIDTLLWSNETIWDNNKYAITDDLQNQINELTATHCQDIEDLTEKHNSELGALSAHIVKQEKIQDEINAYLQDQVDDLNNIFCCFNTGVWGDFFLWDKDRLWANVPGVIESAFADIHIELNSHKEILDSIIEEKNEHFTCFSDDVWCNSSLWDNGRLWPSDFSNFAQAIRKNEDSIEEVKESVKNLAIQTEEEIDSINSEIDNINQRAEKHQSEYQEMLDDIQSYNGCFEKGEWANPFFWNDTDKWYNSPDVVSETETEIISHDSRLTALESQFALILQQFAAQQTIIEQQQTQLETFMDCFTVLNVGRWQNLLLWDNTSKWSDVLITEAAADGGIATVAVKSYDPETETVSI